MKMTLNEFKTLLESELNIQVFYNHTTSKDVVSYPYIVLLDNRWDSFYADDTTYYESIPLTIILHSYDRDFEMEASLKEVLSDNHIPYLLNDISWLPDYLFWQVSFNVELM